jgi:hypothetical protein
MSHGIWKSLQHALIHLGIHAGRHLGEWMNKPAEATLQCAACETKLGESHNYTTCCKVKLCSGCVVAYKRELVKRGLVCFCGHDHS